MAAKIDAQGLSCPQPVLLLKEQIDLGEKEIEILVDCGASFENTQRIAKQFGYELSQKDSINNGFILKFTKQ